MNIDHLFEDEIRLNIMDIDHLIEDEIRLGTRSFDMIAAKFSTTYSHVNLIWEQMCENEFVEE